MAPTQNVVITYETLFELYRREKNRDELQQLEAGFFERAIAYMKDLKKDAPLLADDVVERNRTLAFNIKKLMRDIYARRERKIVNMALVKTVSPQSIIGTAVLLEHEKMLFEHIFSALQSQRGQVFSLLENDGNPVSLSTVRQGVSVVQPPVSLPSHPVVTPSPSHSTPAPSAAEKDRDTIKLEFTQDQPKFIGPNLEIYGPYTVGDTAELPKIIADIILETGKAEAL